MRRRRGANLPAGDHLAASVGFSGRPDRSDRGLRSREFLVIDPDAFRLTWRRTGGASRGRPPRFHARPRGIWRRSAPPPMETVGSASPRDSAGPETTSPLSVTPVARRGKSKGRYAAIGNLRASPAPCCRVSRFPHNPRFLAVAPISHVAGTKVLPTLMCGGTVHLVKGSRPRSRAGRDRSGTRKLHAARTDDDLRALGPSLAKQDRPFLARIAALRGLPDFA